MKNSYSNVQNVFIILESQNASQKLKFLETSEKIEQTSKLLDFALVKLTSAGAVLPTQVIVAVNYFIYDLGDESYYLSFPMM